MANPMDIVALIAIGLEVVDVRTTALMAIGFQDATGVPTDNGGMTFAQLTHW